MDLYSEKLEQIVSLGANLKLRRHIAQARINAIKIQIPAYDRLHNKALRLGTYRPSIAPLFIRKKLQGKIFSAQADTSIIAALAFKTSSVRSVFQQMSVRKTVLKPFMGHRGVVASIRAHKTSTQTTRAVSKAFPSLLYKQNELSRRSFAPVAQAKEHEVFESMPHARAVPMEQPRFDRPSQHSALEPHELKLHSSAQRREPDSGVISQDKPLFAKHLDTSFEGMLDDYFYRQSRLPPNGGTAFNPRLSLTWSAIKIPG